MSPRTGRPTDEPKHGIIKMRASENDMRMLEYCQKKTGLSKSDILRLGIKKVYESLK